MRRATKERASAIASILQTRLFDRLRASLGATYSIAAGYTDTTPQRGYGTITVTFGSAPDTADRLAGEALEEIERLRRDGPTAQEVSGALAARTADLRTRMARNDYWIEGLTRARLQGFDAVTIGRAPDTAAEALTVEVLTEAARRFLPADRFTQVTLLPDLP